MMLTKKNVIVGIVAFSVGVSLGFIFGQLFKLSNVMCHIFNLAYDCIPTIVGGIIALIGVLYTVKQSRKDTNDAIKQAKEDTDNTITESKRVSKELLYAGVKPYIYSLSLNQTSFDVIECDTFTFRNVIRHNKIIKMQSCIKNTSTGIAIIKRILIDNGLDTNNSEYISESHCLIEKGEKIKIFLEVSTGATTSGSVEVQDIYGNTYVYPLTLRGKFFYINTPEQPEQPEQPGQPEIMEQESNSSNSIKAKNITQSIVAQGIDNTITTGITLSEQENDFLNIYRKADGKTQIKIMDFVYNVSNENK